MIVKDIKGLLRHVLIRRGVKTNQTMVVLVCNENMWWI